MRILITNAALRRRSGTECYAVELGAGLRLRGHEVLYFSPRLGMTAVELRTAGFFVTDNLDSIEKKPDVIHGQHTVSALRAACAFPDVPLLYICHDGRSPSDVPVPAFMADAYAGVGRFTAERIVRDTGIEFDRVHLLGNVVDTDRFQCREHFAPLAKKALIYSGSVQSDQHFRLIRSVCRSLDLELDEAAERANGFFEKPENHLKKYDLIFCKARCAMEAMASGAHVVLIGDNGIGPNIDMNNVDELRQLNFGMQALTDPHSEAILRARIEAYDPVMAGRIAQWVRVHLTPDQWLNDVEGVYRSLIERPSLRSQEAPEHAARKFKVRDWCLRWSSYHRRWEFHPQKARKSIRYRIGRECRRIWSQIFSVRGQTT